MESYLKIEIKNDIDYIYQSLDGAPMNSLILMYEDLEFYLLDFLSLEQLQIYPVLSKTCFAI